MSNSWSTPMSQPSSRSEGFSPNLTCYLSTSSSLGMESIKTSMSMELKATSRGDEARNGTSGDSGVEKDGDARDQAQESVRTKHLGGSCRANNKNRILRLFCSTEMSELLETGANFACFGPTPFDEKPFPTQHDPPDSLGGSTIHERFGKRFAQPVSIGSPLGVAWRKSPEAQREASRPSSSSWLCSRTRLRRLMGMRWDEWRLLWSFESLFNSNRVLHIIVVD